MAENNQQNSPTSAVPLERLVMPLFRNVFPFEYSGGGYFRKKGVKKGVRAEILHGEQAINYILNKLKKRIEQNGSLNKLQDEVGA